MENLGASPDVNIEMIGVNSDRLMDYVAFMRDDMIIHEALDLAKQRYLTARSMMEAEDDVKLTDEEKIKWDLAFPKAEKDFGYGSDQR